MSTATIEATPSTVAVAATAPPSVPQVFGGYQPEIIPLPTVTVLYPKRWASVIGSPSITATGTTIREVLATAGHAHGPLLGYLFNPNGSLAAGITLAHNGEYAPTQKTKVGTKTHAGLDTKVNDGDIILVTKLAPRQRAGGHLIASCPTLIIPTSFADELGGRKAFDDLEGRTFGELIQSFCRRFVGFSERLLKADGTPRDEIYILLYWGSTTNNMGLDTIVEPGERVGFSLSSSPRVIID